MGISKGAAIEYLEKLFGGPLDDKDFEFVVGLSLLVVAANNPDRISLTLVNLGTTVIVVSPTQATTLTHGIRLDPSGGTLTLDLVEDGILPTREWTAVSDLAGGALYALSVHREGVL